MSDAKQTILVTGASSGFGLLIARTFLEKGYEVFATMRDPEERNQGVVAELAAFADTTPGTLHVLELDVTDDASVEAAVARALAQEDHLDVVVNNAGVGSGGWAEAYGPDQWRRLFEINVFGVQRVNRAVLPSMREAGQGLLVHVSSIMGRVVIPFSAPYTASKWALEGLAESYRYELAGSGVDVAIVEPGGFPTGIGGRLLPADDEARHESYGERKDLPAEMWGGFMAQLEGENAPDPQLVADAVLALAEAAPGTRPLRTVVDPLTDGAGAPALNEASDGIQKELLGMLGL